MAIPFLHFSQIFVTFLPLLLIISPTHSLTCTTQTLTNTPTKYTNCTDLPSLKAYLHWTHDTTNSTLSIAFIATPATPNGWIGWGINPTATGMAGTQALIALKDSKGSLVVKTYNLVSYKSIQETTSNMSSAFKVLDSKAEDVNGTMMIFAKLVLHENMKMDSLNQVWQVGSSVKDGVPEKHNFAPENLAAKGTLNLVNNSAAPSSATGGGGASGKESSSGGVLGGYVGVLLSFGIVLISLSFY